MTGTSPAVSRTAPRHLPLQLDQRSSTWTGPQANVSRTAKGPRLVVALQSFGTSCTTAGPRAVQKSKWFGITTFPVKDITDTPFSTGGGGMKTAVKTRTMKASSLKWKGISINKMDDIQAQTGQALSRA